jgi:Protein of unknown function (DUF3631)
MPLTSFRAEDIPWTCANTRNLIDGLEQYIRRYCVLDSACYLPLAVWCTATHLADHFDAFPYLVLQSPVKRCGKTRLLEVLEMLCARPWRGTAPTSAALYRMMVTCPTLLLDEVEGLKTGKQTSESQQAILAILNAGHRRGATVPRCSGKDGRLEFFPVYGPKAFAAIGGLPDTLSDRAILVTLQRRKPEQRVERFLFGRARTAALAIQETLVTWTNENDESVRAVYESLPDLVFVSDREADLWMPLFATCSVAAPDRMRELKDCAIALSGAKQAEDMEDSTALRLLSDIHQIWPKDVPYIATAELLGRLREIDESIWAEQEMTARRLASLLRPFQIYPRQIRIGKMTLKGYLRGSFAEVVSRYLPKTMVRGETSETPRDSGGRNDDPKYETDDECFG